MYNHKNKGIHYKDQESWFHSEFQWQQKGSLSIEGDASFISGWILSVSLRNVLCKGETFWSQSSFWRLSGVLNLLCLQTFSQSDRNTTVFYFTCASFREILPIFSRHFLFCLSLFSAGSSNVMTHL